MSYFHEYEVGIYLMGRWETICTCTHETTAWNIVDAWKEKYLKSESQMRVRGMKLPDANISLLALELYWEVRREFTVEELERDSGSI